MALLIKTSEPLEILGGIKTNNLYVRFDYNHINNGKSLKINNSVYVSKEAYKENTESNKLNKPGYKMLPLPDSFQYNRKENGVDILLYIHEKCKEILSSNEYGTVQVSDASTGKYMYDPSTGQPILEEVIKTPKFVNEEEISIVDLD